MTKLTIRGTSAYFETQADRPAGAIRHIDEIRFYKGDVWPPVVHTVAQSGYIETYSIVETHHVAKFVWQDGGMSSGFLIATRKNSFDNETRVCQFYLEQYGISDDGRDSQQAFQAFFDLEQAQAYSDHMKNDADYMESVKLWHKHCNSWLDYADDYYYNDDSNWEN